MVKFLLWASVGLALVAGMLSTRSHFVKKPVESVENTVNLNEPEYEWVACNCPDKLEPGYPPVLGLDQGDFIKHQQYMQGLKHQALCNRN